MHKIYREIDVKNNIDTEMWKEVLRILNDAVAEGVSISINPPTYADDFYEALRRSNEVFAAFKVHSMGEKMSAKLLTHEGKLKSYREWADDVKGITSHYVGSWLRTEYDTAIIRAHMAADWQSFERNKDIMPNLRWLPTTSVEPDSHHKTFWQHELTLPVDHPFWSRHHPGDHWNCKCMLEQTDDPANPDILTDIEIPKPQRGLENNPGKDFRIFNDTHPYFSSSCSKCSFYTTHKNIFVRLTNRKKDCYNCIYLDRQLTSLHNG